MRHCAICQAVIEKGDAKTCGPKCRMRLRRRTLRENGNDHGWTIPVGPTDAELDRRAFAIRMAAVPGWRRVEPIGAVSGECEVGR